MIDTDARGYGRAGRGLALCVAAVLSLSAPAAAQTRAADKATAEALFRDAKQLMRKKEYAEACRKLEESQRLDPQHGTLLNLAVCHAREGKTASAWGEFQEALAVAREAKRRDRIRLAETELRKLEPRLSRLTIRVSERAERPGLKVTRGGAEVPSAAWGTAVPVDPGTIELAAEAPGYERWTRTVEIEERRDVEIEVPAIAALPPPPKPKPKPKPAPKEIESGGLTRTLAYVAGGVGVVGIGVGSYFGLRAISKGNESEEHCKEKLCDARGVELDDQASTAATISNVGFGVGVLGLATGVTLFVISQPDGPEAAPRTPSAVTVVPAIGAGSSGVLLSGAW